MSPVVPTFLGRRFLGSIVVAFAVLAFSPVAPGSPIPAAHAGEPTNRLEVVGQTFGLEPGGVLAVSLLLPARVGATTFDAESRIDLISHPVIGDRATFLRTLDDGPRTTSDDVRFSLDPARPDSRVTISDFAGSDFAGSDLAGSDLAGEGTVVTLTVVTEMQEDIEDLLQINGAGVHPLTIELRAAGRTYDALTFVNRLPVDEAIAGEMSISIMMGQTTPPRITDDGVVEVTDEQISELSALADTLTALDETVADTGIDDVPRTVSIEPATLEALAVADPELFARLSPLLAKSELIARPRLPLDPGAVSAASTDDRYATELYTRWLQEGEDVFGRVVRDATVDRSVYLISGALSTDGAQLRRQLGTRMLVMPYEVYAATDGSTQELTDTSQLLTVVLPEGSLPVSSLPAAVIDPHLSARLDDPTDGAYATAVALTADLLVMAREVELNGGLVQRHGIVLARSDGGVIDAATMGDLIGLLAATPGIRAVDLSELATSVDLWVLDGLPVTLQLPTSSTVDLAPRLALIDGLSDDILAYGSMLPGDDPAFAEWDRILGALPSTSVSDQQAATMIRDVEQGFTRFRNAIEVEASSFTLTGRNSTVRFTLRNLTDTTLTVRVQMSSPKINFPDGDQLIALPPTSDTPVTVNVQALSNGKSSVFLRVLAPAESQDVPIVDEMVLTARVNSFAGLGQLVTGAGVLLVVMWWARHWRQNRRAQLAASDLVRHPAARPTSSGLPPS